jgi:heptaprenylglyceryl phosphate synthase
MFFSPAIVCNTGVLSDGIWIGGSAGVLKRNMELGNPSCSTDDIEKDISTDVQVFIFSSSNSVIFDNCFR